jgi:hemerythrin-like domain-containing protein
MPDSDGRSAPGGSKPNTNDVYAAPAPIAAIEEEHAFQLELCNLLEFLADSLPYRFEPAVVRVAVAILLNGFPQHIKLEEEVLFPLLRRHTAKATHLTAMLEQLEDEHETDEGPANEIADALETLAESGRPDNAEMLGYMLRGFFESQRRHIGWENHVVLLLAREILSREDLAQLQSWIMASGQWNPRVLRIANRFNERYQPLAAKRSQARPNDRAWHCSASCVGE